MNTIYKISLYLNLIKHLIKHKFIQDNDKYDLFLKNYFKNKKKGLYIDVGCYHPIRLSNTFFLFKKGWKGINIDISKESIDLFKIARKYDINLNIGIGSKNKIIHGYFYKNLFFSNTLNYDHAKKLLKKINKKKIQIVKLQQVIDKFIKNKKIDFLDIDCEGNDLDVVKGIEFKKNNIDLISIELHGYNAKTKYNSSLIFKILKKNKFKKNFYIFDSFEGGLSNFSYKDRNKRQKLDKKDELKIINYFSSEEKSVLKLLKNFKFVKIFKGWIPKRFSEIKNKKIIFLHLDVDLYKPTLDTLNFFYKNLLPGGVVVCDDYNHSSFPGAKKAWDEFFFEGKKNYSFFYEVPLGGCFLIK